MVVSPGVHHQRTEQMRIFSHFFSEECPASRQRFAVPVCSRLVEVSPFHGAVDLENRRKTLSADKVLVPALLNSHAVVGAAGAPLDILQVMSNQSEH